MDADLQIIKHLQQDIETVQKRIDELVVLLGSDFSFSHYSEFIRCLDRRTDLSKRLASTREYYYTVHPK